VKVEAVDVDEGLNGQVSYHLVRGNDDGHFVLDSDLGTLRVSSQLDREQVTINVPPSLKGLFLALLYC